MKSNIDKLESNEKSFLNSLTSFEDIENIMGSEVILTKEDVELFLNFFKLLVQEVSSIVQNWQEMSKEAQTQYGKTLDVFRDKLLKANSPEEEKFWTEEIKKIHGQIEKTVADNSPQNVIQNVCVGLSAGLGVAGVAGLVIWALSNNNKKCATGLNMK